MDLYTYLIENKDHEFDHKGLRTFKSLKAYSYYLPTMTSCHVTDNDL